MEVTYMKLNKKIIKRKIKIYKRIPSKTKLIIQGGRKMIVKPVQKHSTTPITSNREINRTRIKNIFVKYSKSMNKLAE